MSAAPLVERIGSYGLNSNHEYQDQGKGLCFLKQLPSSFNFNLLEGIDIEPTYEDHKEKYENRDKVGNTIIWMIKHQDASLNNSKGGGDGKLFKDIDFVCGNGMFKVMMNLPFETYYSSKIVIAVTKFKSVYFMKRIEKKEEKSEMSQHQIEAIFAGLKFEQLVTSKLDGKEQGVTYYNVMKTTIGGHKIIYPCEVDCVKSNITREPEMDDFIELKTVPPHKYKWSDGSVSKAFATSVSRKWWIQCHMAGVNEIAIGVKDQPKGITGNIRCNRFERISVKSLEQSFGNGPDWTVEAAVEEVAKNLNKIKEFIKEDNPEVVYVFMYEEGIIVRKEKKKADNDGGKYRVLTKGKIDQLNELELSIKIGGLMKVKASN